MAAIDLTGAAIGTPDADGLAPWIVTLKAPARKRIQHWTVTHTLCGTMVDLPHTLLLKATAGKSTIPPCVACTPAESLPGISHGMHIGCGAVHLLDTPCPDGIVRDADGLIPASGPAAPLPSDWAEKAAALAKDRPVMAPGGHEIERIPPTSTSTGAIVGRLPDDEFDGLTLSAPGAAIDPGPEEYEPPGLSLATPSEPAGGMCGGPCDCGPEGPCKNEQLGLPSPAELAQAFASVPVPSDLAESGAELVAVVSESLDLDRSQYVPHSTAPSTIVYGGCDRLDAPHDYLEVIERHGGAYTDEVPEGLTPSSPGASALGGCEKKLGHRLAFGKQEFESSWAAEVGKAVHAHLDKNVFAIDKATLPDGSPRWRSNYWITDPICCPLDLFDVLEGRLIDFKVTSKTQIDKAKRGQVAEKYQVQAQLLGLGMQRDGYEVRSVALLFLPASGKLRDGAWWEATYDPAIALAAIARRDRIKAMLSVAAPSVVLPALSMTEDYCSSCPAFGAHCPGVFAQSASSLTLAAS